jgi:hypothetical protein
MVAGQLIMWKDGKIQFLRITRGDASEVNQ